MIVAKKDEKDEAQRAAEEAAAATPQARSMVVPGNDLSGYLGTAPEYQNYASVHNKPFLTDDERYRFTVVTDEEAEAQGELRDKTGSEELGDEEPPALVESETLTEQGQVAKDRAAAQAEADKEAEEKAAAEKAEGDNEADNKSGTKVESTAGGAAVKPAAKRTAPGSK